jgi:hypothetical protein
MQFTVKVLGLAWILQLLSACVTHPKTESTWMPLMTQSFEVSLPGMPRAMEYIGTARTTQEPMVTRTYTLEQGRAVFMIGEVDLPARLLTEMKQMDILQKSALYDERLQQTVKAVTGRVADAKLITFRGFEAQRALIESGGYRFENVLFFGNDRQYQLQFLASQADWDKAEVIQARRTFFDSFRVLQLKESALYITP